MEDTNKALAEQCPEFPHFGARYPDATCIDGYLWDLDKCDTINGETQLYGGGDDPCPFCNTEAYIEWAGVDPEDEEAPTKEQVLNYINQLKERYGYKTT
jgi:hypothetical protein